MISINIVLVESSYNYIEYLLYDLFSQDHTDIEINILNNSKIDFHQTVNLNSEHKNVIRLFNTYPQKGFCENHNYLINHSNGKYLLILNPDVRLEKNFLYEAMQHFSDSEIGTISPLLYRMTTISSNLSRDLCDSAGMKLTPNVRHSDIFSNKKIFGEHKPKLIWGVSGAALFIRRDVLERIKLNGGCYFDERFFMGREDADLAFRLQAICIKSLFVPQSIGYHIRTTLPENRQDQSPSYNFHQLKNRYLLMMNNISIPVFLLLLPFIIVRELQILCYLLLYERSSFSVYAWLFKNRSGLSMHRREIQRNRKQSIIDELSWYFLRYKKYNK
jgi:GT2 family glycosyltransferase